MAEKIEKQKLNVKAFYEKYPCGGGWAKDDRRNIITPWFSEVFGYRDAKYRNKNILDAGCGIGIDMASHAMNSANVVGIDMSRKPLETAKRRIEQLNLKAKLIQGDLEMLPCRRNSFDMCYSNGVLHHTPNPEAALSEVKRVLKNEGEVIFLLYHRYSLATIFHLANRVVYNFILKVTGNKNALLRILEIFFRRKLNAAEVSAFREIWEHPLVTYYTKRSAKRLFGLYFRSLNIKCYDSMYPLSRFFPMVQKFDLLGNIFGRFIIIEGRAVDE